MYTNNLSILSKFTYTLLEQRQHPRSCEILLNPRITLWIILLNTY